jgi:penicillin-binding protein 2
MRKQQLQTRMLFMILVFLLAGFGLAGRLFYIQVLRGPEFAMAAVIQRSLRQVYATGRGQILDRNGKSLLDTVWEPVLISFDPILNREARSVLSLQDSVEKRGTAHIIRDKAVISYLRNEDIDGLLPASWETRYGANFLAPHVTGYVQREEIAREKPPYRELTFLPRSGLELYFNEQLSASRPATLAAVVDAQSRLVAGLGYRDWRDENPRSPHDVVTTLDSRIQALTETIGEKYLDQGAIVVLEPKTGDILALASFPDYSTRDMYSGISQARYEELEKDPRQPFVNRAINAYSPGSVFKLVLAAAALDSGLANYKYTCEGGIEVGDRTFSCYGGHAHGELDLKKALAASCNSYFIHLGQLLGQQKVLEYARRFGLGEATGITLYGEKAGRLPTQDELPFLGDLANTSIGQGLVATTPLQLARLVTIIANDGRDIKPRLVSRITDKNGATTRYFPVQPGTRVISAQTARLLKEMMIEVTQTGTAHHASSPYFTAAGKSGTAQTGRGDDTNRWFAGFAPVEENPLVIVVFAEERKGNTTPAHIFRVLAEAILPVRNN